MASHQATEDAAAVKTSEKLKSKVYNSELKKLHVVLVKVQEWVKHNGLKVCVVFEGRDALVSMVDSILPPGALAALVQGA